MIAPTKKSLSDERLLLALISFGEDSSIDRVREVRMRIDLRTLPDLADDGAVLQAVDTARSAADAASAEERSLTAAGSLNRFELKLHGFDGGTDETDHLIVDVATALTHADLCGHLAAAGLYPGKVTNIALMPADYPRDFMLPLETGTLAAYVANVVMDSPADSLDQPAPEKYLLSLTTREEKMLGVIAPEYEYAHFLREQLVPEEQEVSANSDGVDNVYSLSAADASEFAELVRAEVDGHLPMAAGSLRSKVDRLYCDVSGDEPGMERFLSAQRLALMGLLLDAYGDVDELLDNLSASMADGLTREERRTQEKSNAIRDVVLNAYRRGHTLASQGELAIGEATASSVTTVEISVPAEMTVFSASQSFGPALRVVRGEQAIKAWHVSGQSLDDAPEVGEPDDFAVTGILADLRHYCDVHGLDFGKLDRDAYVDYAEQLALARDEGPSPQM